MKQQKPLKQTFLYKEIQQQPDVIQNLVSSNLEAHRVLANLIHEKNIQHVVIAARGTSDNAGRYAKYLFGAHNGFIVSLATPSLFTIYKAVPDLRNTLVLGISQSGKSPDIVSVLAEGKRQGALTAAITNIPSSDLADTADIVLDLAAGVENSLAATKTYIAQLTTLAILSVLLENNPARMASIKKLPEVISAILQQEELIAGIAERYRYMKHCAVIGRGFNYATAFEFSLKLKELTYTIAEPYSSADFLHGPVALLNRGFPVFITAPSGEILDEMKTLVKMLQELQAEVIMISDDNNIQSAADISLPLIRSVPEWLSPISAIIPGQMFAMHLAYTRGLDPDTPRGLKKVTETF